MAIRTRAERQEEDRERKAQEIKETAINIFSRKGYTGTTIEDISKELGYAKASLYYYFKSKEEIFTAIVFDTLDRLVGDMDAMTDPQCPAPEDMGKIIDHFIDEKFEKTGLFQVFHQIQTFFTEIENPTSRFSMLERLSKIMERVVTITSRGGKDGDLRSGDPRMLATLFMGMIFGVSFFNAGPPPHPDSKESFKTLVRSIIIDGFTSGTNPRKE